MNASTRHWAELNEVTFEWGTRLLLSIHRHLGRWPFLLCLWPVVTTYWLLHASARRASARYLARWRKHFPTLDAPPSCLAHFLRFAEVLLDKLIAIDGTSARARIESLEMDAVRPLLDRGQGAIFVTAHIGCLELCQAAAETVPGLQMNVLVHTRHAERFNAMLARMRPNLRLRLLQVTEISPATAVDLSARVAHGEFVAIVGDRVPVGGGRTVSAELLGETAQFPVGPWVLASLLRCPVMLMSCLRLPGHQRYRLRIEPFADRIDMPREQRTEVLGECVCRYAAWLELRLREAPLEWFNFFDFWRQRGSDIRG